MAFKTINKILYVEAGPQFGFLVGVDDGGDNSKDNFESTDFGVGAGAGVELFDTFDLDVSYKIGTKDLSKGTDDKKNK